jgi:hypothetical protein
VLERGQSASLTVRRGTRLRNVHDPGELARHPAGMSLRAFASLTTLSLLFFGPLVVLLATHV